MCNPTYFLRLVGVLLFKRLICLFHATRCYMVTQIMAAKRLTVEGLIVGERSGYFQRVGVGGGGG